MINTFVVDAVRACLGEVYLVGGAIRDSLMGNLQNIKDYDFTTPLSVDDVINKLEDNHYRVIKHSAKHGTVTAYVGKTKVEISTFRLEEYNNDSKGDPSNIQFHNSLQDDLRRRDFTINAIAHDGENYIDPFNGSNDIIDEKIRAVGDPHERFEEDPLRMLRAIRFVSELGFHLTPETYDAIVKSSPLITRVSSQRLTHEFEALLTGKYWQRAIALGFESGLLESVLAINIKDGFIDLLLEYLKQKGEALETPLKRWGVFISAIVHARVNSDSLKTLQAPLIDIFDQLRSVFSWSKKFEDNLHHDVFSIVADEDYANLEGQYIELVKADDYRQYIVYEKMLRIKLRQCLNERNLNKAHIISKDLLKTQIINFNRRIDRGEDRGELIQEFKSYMLDTIKNIYLKYVEECGFFDTSKRLNEILDELLYRKNIFNQLPFGISDDDKRNTIEESISLANNVLNGRITSFKYPELLDKNKKIKRTKERLTKIYKGYIRELIQLRKPPYEDGVIQKRSIYNLKCAKLLLERDMFESIQYYSHLVDYYNWKALTASNIKEFMQSYDDMNQILDTIENSEGSGAIYSRLNGYLSNARCLAYAVTLTNDINLKIEFVMNIIAYYKLSGYGKFMRNIDRYQLLFDWLNIVRTLLEKDYKASKAVLLKIPYLKSYHYLDIDEDYIQNNMPEIDKVRTNFYDLEAFLSRIHGINNDIEIRHSNLYSVALLKSTECIDGTLAYEIFKNILKKLISESVPLEPVSLLQQTNMADLIMSENLEIISKGESEKVEFKESWRYDVEKQEIDSSGLVLESAIKTIAAFMNTNGGKLFIGVKDDSTITGLEVADFIQYKRKVGTQLGLQDSLKKLIDDQIGKALGAAHMTLISVKFDISDKKTFCIVDVSPSNVDVFYKDRFFVRNSASTRELNSREYSEYRSLKPINENPHTLAASLALSNGIYTP